MADGVLKEHQRHGLLGLRIELRQVLLDNGLHRTKLLDFIIHAVLRTHNHKVPVGELALRVWHHLFPLHTKQVLNLGAENVL